MFAVIAYCGNGYCGCDSEEVFFYEEGTSDREIDEDVDTWARENGESFAYVHFGWEEEYSDEDYEEYMENNVTFNWDRVTREKYVEWCENWGYEVREDVE